MTEEKSIYNLELHEILVGDNEKVSPTIIRVPGGWVYYLWIPGGEYLDATFVPYSNEFNPKEMRGTEWA